MIAYISGALVSAGENYIVIDNHGMGYRIFVSGKFLEHIPAYGTQIKIYTHMYIREDELTLYGFHSEEELSVFRILSESRYGNPYSSYDPGASARGDLRGCEDDIKSKWCRRQGCIKDHIGIKR